MPAEATNPPSDLNYVHNTHSMSDLSDHIATGLISPPTTPPKKLATPYTIGSRFTARRHRPPPVDYEGHTDGTNRGDLNDASHLDWCLSHPPKTGGIITEEYCDIEVARPIRTGVDYGAQVVLLRDGLIAKIFDPLFYRFHDQHDWAPPKNPRKRNVTLITDDEYLVETAAYTHLTKAGVVGNLTPAYHGSWVFDVPVNIKGESRSRQVHMILLEYVAGTRMLDINPQDLTQAERENIMFKAIEAETDLALAGVRHGDFEPRNIILCPSTPSSTDEDASANSSPVADPNLRICIIDFADSGIFSTPDGQPSKLKNRNPLFQWSEPDVWTDYGWLPHYKEAQDWLWRMWSDGGKDGKYVAVEKHPDQYGIRLKEANSTSNASEALQAESGATMALD
ncbi:hypothetical protein T440DRAFT_472040 [Plenodomus tracheiphilus IPT5]|uniref:Tyrosinase copper-binding domain-containing protein n=1 Tax=Plenodomus tracheiphilus IPT5 TaxID=1408161 RepID=A0A6A7AV00_9PLEO|nr:hypothetical protein T440DRAFT_472040 [Plenodomus tracheiphilus IPT5]